MQALLTEVIYLRYPGYIARVINRKEWTPMPEWVTHDILRECDTNDTHRGAGELRLSVVPV